MLSEPDDILEKLNYLKVQKLKLASDIAINTHFQNEYIQVDQLVRNTEVSLDALNVRGRKVEKLAEKGEGCVEYVANLSELLDKSVATIEKKLENLFISKERTTNAITSKATEKLALFPQDSKSNKQKELVASLQSKLTSIYQNDDDVCNKIEAEIKKLKEEIDTNEIASQDLQEIVDQLQMEANSMMTELERYNDTCALLEVHISKSYTDIEELKVELQDILDHAPSEVILIKMSEELETGNLDVAKAQKEIEILTMEFEECLNQYNDFILVSTQEEKQEMENFKLEEEAFKGDINALELEIKNGEFQLAGIHLKKDLYWRLLEEKCVNKTAEELEQELDANDAAEADELKKWEGELQSFLSMKQETEIQATEDIEKLDAHLEAEKAKQQAIQDEIILEEKVIEEEFTKNTQDWLNLEERSKAVQADIDQLEQKKLQIAKEKSILLENSQRTFPIPLTIKSEISDSGIIIEQVVVPSNSVPSIPGLQPFSPNTIQKKQDGRKKNKRAVDGYSLEYTDLSRDGNEWVLTESPEIKKTAKRPRKSEPTKKLKQENKKPTKKILPVNKIVEIAPISIVQVAPAAPPPAFCDDELDSLLVDDEDPIEQGSLFFDDFHAMNVPEEAIREADMDSLYGDDDQDEQDLDSIFGDSPAKNIRCIPENVFLNNSHTTIGEIITPPAAASSYTCSMNDDVDSLDGYESDQSVWD